MNQDARKAVNKLCTVVGCLMLGFNAGADLYARDSYVGSAVSWSVLVVALVLVWQPWDWKIFQDGTDTDTKGI